MSPGERVREAIQETGKDLLALGELLGYLMLFGAVAHFVQTVPWYDALTGVIFIMIMVVRRFRRWLDKISPEAD